MTIYQRMAAMFAEADLPGFLQEWQATEDYPTIPDKYCTYLVEREGEALATDDEPAVYRYVVWVDLYGRTDVTADWLRLTRALRAAGFYIPFTRDMDNVRLSDFQYHRRMQINFYEYELEEE